MKKRLKIAAFCMAAIFSACGAERQGGAPAVSASQKTEITDGYCAPPMAQSIFNKAAATGENGVLIDSSSAQSGYIGVTAQSDKRLKIRIIKDGVTYTYDLPNSNEQTFYPLSMGNGEYLVKILQNTTEINYLPICTQTLAVELVNEFEPFLRPSIYCGYSEQSACVIKAAEIVKGAKTDAEAAALIYEYIKDNILYDKKKASEATSIYVPSPDETFTSNKGICFDYASLAAAMLRSQGIPTKIIRGNVAPNDISHAWNMIWLKDKGWIEVNIQLPSKNWERIDLTFAAGGAGEEFVGDASNYTDMFVY